MKRVSSEPRVHAGHHDLDHPQGQELLDRIKADIEEGADYVLLEGKAEEHPLFGAFYNELKSFIEGKKNEGRKIEVVHLDDGFEGASVNEVSLTNMTDLLNAHGLPGSAASEALGTEVIGQVVQDFGMRKNLNDFFNRFSGRESELKGKITGLIGASHLKSMKPVIEGVKHEGKSVVKTNLVSKDFKHDAQGELGSRLSHALYGKLGDHDELIEDLSTSFLERSSIKQGLIEFRNQHLLGMSDKKAQYQAVDGMLGDIDDLMRVLDESKAETNVQRAAGRVLEGFKSFAKARDHLLTRHTSQDISRLVRNQQSLLTSAGKLHDLLHSRRSGPKE
ncbi:MAG: hypothetical protein GOV15_02770 [Candidatus Diapherotrites archaeon]|nr:hypothetical protein [Candidatus Diapherotrites archaeon]